MASEMKTTIVINGKLSPSLSKAFGQAQKQASKTQAVMKKVGSAAGKALKVGVTAAAAAAAAAVTYAVKEAAAYETSLAKVSTIADQSKKSISALSGEVLRISDQTGTAATEINEALYQAISAGADTAKATDLVHVAVKAARGGFTDTATAVDGLTSVLNAYNMKTEDAEKLANQFLITQNLGKTTFGDLAQSIGKLAPITKAANVGTEEMLSSIAALTANGIQTSESISGMKAAISNIIKPTAEAQKMAAALGMEFHAGALETKGLSGFLAELRKKTGGNLEIMSKLFGSVEGLNAVLTLTSDGGMNLMNNSLREMGSNTTALEDAYQKMSNTTAEQSKRFMVHIKNMAITLGSKLLPAVNGAMDTLGKLLSGDMAGAKLGGLDLLHRMGLDDAQAARVMGVFETVGQDLFNFTTKYIGAMKNFDFSPMIGMLEHLRGILRPILDFVGKVFPQNVKLMNAVYPALSNALGALRPVVQMIFGVLGQIVTAVMPVLIPVVEKLGALFAALQPTISWLASLIGGVLTNVFQAIMPVISGVMGALGGVIDFITGVFSGNWNLAWQGICGIMQGVWDTIKGIVIGAVNGILAAINGLLGLVEGAVNNIINGINSVTGAVGIPAIPNLTIPKIPTIPMLAEGGTFLQPMLAVVGDAPETIVPHGNTPRSRALLREAALGVGGGLGRQAVTINFSPVVYAGGDGQAKRGILEAEIEFERRMEAYFAKQRRVAF